MSSTILHDAHRAAERDGRPADARRTQKNPFLVALGERVRALRARRGMTRKALALAADVSERHLANLEYGVGNAVDPGAAAGGRRAAMLAGRTDRRRHHLSSPEWLLLRELLEHRDEATLRRVRVAVGELLGTGGANAAAQRRAWR
jgi:XRE family aerobic/anaerobic benzoate catabolism transcriptional regulator